MKTAWNYFDITRFVQIKETKKVEMNSVDAIIMKWNRTCELWMNSGKPTGIERMCDMTLSETLGQII